MPVGLEQRKQMTKKTTIDEEKVETIFLLKRICLPLTERLRLLNHAILALGPVVQGRIKLT